MADKSLPHEQTVVLSAEEWTEIGNCAIALHDALKAVREQGASLEVVVSVKVRLDRCISRIEHRLDEGGES